MHIPDNQQQQINLRKESTIATANKSKLTHVNKTSNKIQKKKKSKYKRTLFNDRDHPCIQD